MQRLILILCLIALPLRAQDAGPLQAALQVDAPAVERASRGTVGEVLDRLAATGSPNLQGFLEAWRNKGVVMREADGTFFLGERDGDVYALTDIDTGATTVAGRREVKELKPNAGVRGEIATALIRFQLTDQRPAARRRALAAVERNPSSELLDPLRRSLEGEPDPGIAASKAATLRRLEAGFADDPALRIAAIEALSGGLAIEDRAALSRILQTRRVVSKAGAVPDGVIVAARIEPGADMSETDAYEALVAERLAPPRVTSDARNAALAAAIEDGTVAGVPVATLDNEEARWAAYDALAALGAVPARVTDTAFAQALETHAILDVYLERDGDVIAAAHDASEAIKARLGLHRAADLGLDALSLASIYFLAAVGLAVTFGVMGVINMAHGEFIMIGAYTGYLVQRVVPDYTLSLIVALPVAFLVAGAAGVALERLVVRHLMHRPLETLLATFGISIALQQIAKNIFGTQAVPLTSPAWLAGPGQSRTRYRSLGSEWRSSCWPRCSSASSFTSCAARGWAWRCER